ncbi:MAG: hypothetical protein ABIJ41_00670 [Candidatus Omnitrophota bacterium]
MMSAKKGFTLIEVLFTAGLLIAGIIGLMQVFIQSSRLSTMSANMTFVMSEAQTKLEEIRDHTFNLIATDYAQGGALGNTFPLSKVNGTGVIYLKALNADLLEVKIVVSWRTDDNRLIGEDSDLDGVLDEGEDQNGNGELDSVTMLATLISKR